LLTEELDRDELVRGFFASGDERKIEIFITKREDSDWDNEQPEEEEDNPKKTLVYVNLRESGFWDNIDHEIPLKIWARCAVGDLRPGWKIFGNNWEVDTSDREAMEKECITYLQGIENPTITICSSQEEIEEYYRRQREKGSCMDGLLSKDGDRREPVPSENLESMPGGDQPDDEGAGKSRDGCEEDGVDDSSAEKASNQFIEMAATSDQDGERDAKQEEGGTLPDDKDK
jgi:hypothetical protein